MCTSGRHGSQASKVLLAWDIRKLAPGRSAQDAREMGAPEVQVIDSSHWEGADKKTERFAQTSPIQPARAMTDAHEVSHLPYRDCCSA